MVVLMNTGGVAQTNCFLVADESAGKAVLFDAPDQRLHRQALQHQRAEDDREGAEQDEIAIGEG